MEIVEHAAHEIGEISEISEIKQNYKFPLVANWTKVVRIFVIGPRTLEQIFAEETPTRSDVFVDVARVDASGLKPMTWLGEPLVVVDHDESHHRHRSGTIPVLKGKYRDQIEWQCDVPFEVSAIKKVTDEHHMHGLVDYKGPDEPFIKTIGQMNARRGGSSTPIRSGPTKIMEGRFFHVPWKALYKAHFKLTIGKDQVPLDPDVYCEWH